MMTAETIQRLLEEYVMGTILPEDRTRLLEALNDPAMAQQAEAILLEELTTDKYGLQPGEMAEVPARLKQRIGALIQTAEQPLAHKRRPIYRIPWIRVAAAVLVVIGSAVCYKYLSTRNPAPPLNDPIAVASTIGPGTNKATLTLADGRTIALDRSSSGVVARQGNAQIINSDGGQLTYQMASGGVLPNSWNTVVTPAGGQYEVTLPDGSKAWLDAESSIRFPTGFTGKTREIEMKGEVYLEVAPSAKQPFVVAARGLSIQVLGTSLNINAYEDEPAMKVTLITGSVKVMTGKAEVQLKPGQQAGKSNDDNALTLADGVDLVKTLAWKNNLFDFDGSHLHAVMRQLERWYGIRVSYEGPESNIVFKGEMYKNVNLSDVLEMLREMGVKFHFQRDVLVVNG
ncbi:MAG TPA: FecR domain-containing protein [Puia sp.]|nr:FecR domain-containing protein [Puia sp.]